MVLLGLIAWYAALAGKLLVVWRLFASGIYKRLPFLFIYFLFSLIQHTGFSFILRRGALYQAWYVRTEPFMLALDYAMVVSLYWAIAEFFPRFRVAGTVVLSIVSAGGALAAYLTRIMVAPSHEWETAWQTIVIFQRSVGVVLIAVLAAARLLTGMQRLFPIRVCARRAADIMLLHGIVFVWGVATFSSLAGARYSFVAFLLGLAGSIVTSVLCAAFLTRESDVCSVPQPHAAPAGTEDLARTLEGLRGYARMLDQKQ
jgi:hypothetical protein